MRYFINIPLIKLNTSWSAILVIYSYWYNFFCVQSVQKAKKICASACARANSGIMINCSQAAKQTVHRWWIKESHGWNLWLVERALIVVTAVTHLVIDGWRRLSYRQPLSFYIYRDCSILVKIAVCESRHKEFLALYYWSTDLILNYFKTIIEDGFSSINLSRKRSVSIKT